MINPKLVRFSLLVSCPIILITLTPISAQRIAADTFVDAHTEGLLPSNENNNSVLQKIIDTPHVGTTTINIPTGQYRFKPGAIKLRSNLKFNFAKGASFKINQGALYFVYPSPHAGYNGGIKNIVWDNATFIGSDEQGQSSFTQSLHHAQQVMFLDSTFYNCEKPNGHFLDIDGSRDILVDHSSFWGFNSSPQDEFKEAIQVDYSNLVAMSYPLAGDNYDNLPSYNIYVQHSRFLPIMNHQKIRYYAPNPIGEHVTYNNGKAGIIHDIYFTNNEVVDARPQTGIDTGTINFRGVNRLTIANNHFLAIHATAPANYIRIHNPLFNYHMYDIKIIGNHFTNVKPRYQMILFNTRYRNGSISSVLIQNNITTTYSRPSRFIRNYNSKIVATNNRFTRLVQK
ncbi:N-acetylmuramoyl-L-alanine amidase [Lactiplantibacillus pentosus]|uniref:N-acetylmuramoyl-L-alanine amidase n=1 Tax=Lactiplantibacillus pentosus TaxID=1589 RepID=UPI002182386C|nr:N-acetylmuramoyl-L-alanine amidase [Lactiplantibacillus pentosus]MCT0162142.1 N-acetylmuramoyl-L-alanine amidase [Lactiplantibacillus pentosus]